MGDTLARLSGLELLGGICADWIDELTLSQIMVGVRVTNILVSFCINPHEENTLLKSLKFLVFTFFFLMTGRAILNQAELGNPLLLQWLIVGSLVGFVQDVVIIWGIAAHIRPRDATIFKWLLLFSSWLFHNLLFSPCTFYV